MKNGSVPLPSHYFVLATKDGDKRSASDSDSDNDDFSVTNITSVLAMILDHQPTVQNCLVGREWKLGSRTAAISLPFR